ncbi:MAG TPA: bifunctional diguanylate cyclase/phosphodiesterase [Persephonella sp.]|uniref:Signal transduction response regulator n=1 Tax=Persephonella marina (strain DSM 14350 / EX-H1) TaxID=123214 RepID=C0QTH1_PERMH|nr:MULTISPECIES: bifunctional diguanylate cyclase/phosphodiesterase [Persephonella]ACO04411.1 signal transduction response regulator [Persephonella marina EX-H1]HCB70395.1 bifunctional diguanylate cyclase/phosphodiesterase [Persephonella sp.]
MSRKNLNFENLRKELALKSGTVIENLLKYNSLIKGLRREIKSLSEPQEFKEQSCDLILEEFEKNLNYNIQLVKDGSIRAIDLILLLEKEVVDKKLLQEETKILKEIVLSRENIMDWKGYAKEILRKLRAIYPYDLFFFMFEEDNTIKFYIFYSYIPPDDLKEEIKVYLTENVVKNFKKNPYRNLDFEEIYISNKSRRKEIKKIHIETHQFLPDSPGIGGTLGLIVLPEERLSRKDINILNSILSIMTLVTGSSRALSKAITELEYFAGHDPLTDLYNRRIFEDLLKYEVSRAKRKNYKFSLILIDLDNFKYINDTYGHHIGDIVLKSVADILEASIRDGDLVARIGGDEFVILLSETELEKALIVAERIRKNLENNKLCIFEGAVISVSASLGVVEFPTHGTTKEELMMVVDNALYRAKDLGKNKVYVPTHEEIEKTIKEKRKEFSILQEAIDKELFVPYFQPIYDLKNDNVHAYEVLARLKDEKGEVISAYRFISLAEKLGKIKDIDKTIIKKALTEKKENDLKEKLFLNLSAKDISDDSFWQYIFSVVNDLNIDPEEIVFELTEREAVKETAEVQALIVKLKDKGFGFAIDDFGSGYSSFYYLKYFPIDYVKIDGEFIRELKPSDPKSIAFVESMDLLCKRLNIKTVAESIENEDILKILKNIGIDYGQGFHLGYPESKFL